MRLTVLSLMTLFTASVAWAGEGSANAGKQKSATCTACHGQNGLSPNELWPNLAGQKRAYLVAQLKAFASGERKNELMNGIAKMLDSQDMEDLAAYFSQLKAAP